MKTILTTLILTFGSVFCHGQSMPFFWTVGGDTLGVVFTVEQAQRIDRDLQLLALLEQSKAVCDSANVALLSLVDDSNKLVFLMEVQISELKTKSDIDRQTISALKEQIALANEEAEIRATQLDLRKKQVAEQQKAIKSLKFQKAALTVASGAAGIGLGILVGILLAN